MARTIIVDAMGGDNAPAAMVEGSILASTEFGAEIILVGDEGKIGAELAKHDPKGTLRVVHAPDVIETEDDPTLIAKSKKDCSMAVAFRMLAAGEGDAMVTSGNTGATLAGATLYVKRIRGIRRAALAPILPSKDGGALLIDCGANIDCSPEYLLQFAYMGAYYAGKIMGRKNPRVALLNIGAEETKGDELHVQAYRLMKKADGEGRIRFVGNIEGRDVPDGVCDVIVSDGFSGNILMKAVEGTALYISGLLKKMLLRNTLSKLAALALGKGIGELKSSLDYKEIGGAPLLGISKPVIKAHGSANAYAFRSAISQAIAYAESGIVGDIIRDVELMKVDSANEA